MAARDSAPEDNGGKGAPPPASAGGSGSGRLLKACLFATGLAGIVAEFVLSTLASYLLGNPTLQWTLVLSLMFFAMGLGSRLSRHLAERLLDRFIAVEFILSALCATSAAAAYWGTAFVQEAGAIIYAYAGAIGLLIGLEIPLVTRMNDAYEELRTNIASVMEKDYFGALAGGLLFAFFALPKLGLTYTPIALGTVNFAVASALLWRYRSLLARPGALIAAFWITAVGLVALGVFMKPIVRFGEQSRYRDRVIFEAQTPYQRIVMTQWKGYHWLYLNGGMQFSTYDEERYHEPLVHPAMGLSASRERVLILGGGDGLALREVLKYGDVKRVTLVDLDPEMIRLARTHAVFVEANEGALEDERVDVVTRDAGRFLADDAGIYDVILVDLPDPKGPDLARLYSKEFYTACKRHLSQHGTLVTQSSSPLHARRAFLCVYRTLKAAGFHVLPYHNSIPTMGQWGWHLAMKEGVISEPDLKQRAMALRFSEVETVFLNHEAMAGMLHFWKGMFDGLEDVEVNTELAPVVDRYYRESEWGW